MSNGAGAGTSVAAVKVSTFQRIENRLNETIDMLRQMDTTASSIKDRLIGGTSPDEPGKDDRPESSVFAIRVNASLDFVQEIAKRVNVTLHELNEQT
ncbi:hypothetical protein LCGC14_2700820 [marine sediment metagenome]|uniref:Uncharacterized protein n=1 Tax=marine sediment metagenome TaxID=412755 RepID=A0A0F8ZFS2_9ZZZZ